MVIKIYILLCSQRIGLVEDIVLQTLCGKILLQAGTLESRDSSPRLFLSHPLSTNKCSPLRHLGLSKFNRDIVKKKKNTFIAFRTGHPGGFFLWRLPWVLSAFYYKRSSNGQCVCVCTLVRTCEMSEKRTVYNILYKIIINFWNRLIIYQEKKIIIKEEPPGVWIDSRNDFLLRQPPMYTLLRILFGRWKVIDIAVHDNYFSIDYNLSIL